MKILLLACVISSLSVTTVVSLFKPRLETVFEWKRLNVRFDDNGQEQTLDDQQIKDTMIFDVDVRRDHSSGNETYFVTAIGSAPVNLLMVTDEENEDGKVLRPFPSESWSNLKRYGCTHTIIGAYRIYIDGCNRIWLVDTGMRGDTKLCPPKLVVFDANNNAVINQEIPKNILTINANVGKSHSYPPVSLPVTIVLKIDENKCVDLRNGGAKSITAFIADVTGNSLIWWHNGVFKRLVAREFQPDKNASTYTINGESFTLDDGILGLAVGKGQNKNKLYLSSLSAYDMYDLDIDWFNKSSGHKPSIRKFPGKISSQKAPIIYADDRIFFVELEKQRLVSWSPKTTFTENHLVPFAESNDFNFVSGLKAKQRPWNGPIGPILPWSVIYGCTDFLIASNVYQKYANEGLNLDETNFRIFKMSCAVREPWEGYV